MKNSAYTLIIVVLLVFVGWNLYQQKQIGNGEAEIQQENQETIQDTGSGESEAVITDEVNKEKKSIQPAVTEEKKLMDTDGAYLVYYSNSGFYPAKIQVTKGTDVRFVNESDKALRLKMKENFDNNAYSALNQPTSLANGENYTFPFTDVGLWHYYNMNNTGDMGSVLVY